MYCKTSNYTKYFDIHKYEKIYIRNREIFFDKKYHPYRKTLYYEYNSVVVFIINGTQGTFTLNFLR